MRELWVKVNPSLEEKEKEAFIRKTSPLASAYLVEPEDVELARNSGANTTVSPSKESEVTLVTNLKEIGKAKKQGKRTCMFVTVKSKGDERKIISAAEASADYVAAECPDWKVIPLENLIAEIQGRSKLLAFVSSSEEAKVALGTLEIGVDGVVAETSDANEVTKIYEVVKEVKARTPELESAEKLALARARVTEIKPLGLGARVCIDTCDLLKEGEGLLVGCQSSGLFLVEAEVQETEFVAPRPFRVNAGSIALYVLAPGDKTRYLSELKAGDEVLIVDRQGRNRTASVCRAKIEWRPLLMIEAECQENKIKTILQNAETIRLVTEYGSKSVKDLIVGDKVLARLEEGGRHFGTLVQEEKVIER